MNKFKNLAHTHHTMGERFVRELLIQQKREAGLRDEDIGITLQKPPGYVRRIITGEEKISLEQISTIENAFQFEEGTLARAYQSKDVDVRKETPKKMLKKRLSPLRRTHEIDQTSSIIPLEKRISSEDMPLFLCRDQTMTVLRRSLGNLLHWCRNVRGMSIHECATVLKKGDILYQQWEIGMYTPPILPRTIAKMYNADAAPFCSRVSALNRTHDEYFRRIPRHKAILQHIYNGRGNTSRITKAFHIEPQHIQQTLNKLFATIPELEFELFHDIPITSPIAKYSCFDTAREQHVHETIYTLLEGITNNKKENALEQIAKTLRYKSKRTLLRALEQQDKTIDHYLQTEPTPKPEYPYKKPYTTRE